MLSGCACLPLLFLDHEFPSLFLTFPPSELTDHFGIRTEYYSEVAGRTTFDNVDSVFPLGISPDLQWGNVVLHPKKAYFRHFTSSKNGVQHGYNWIWSCAKSLVSKCSLFWAILCIRKACAVLAVFVCWPIFMRRGSRIFAAVCHGSSFTCQIVRKRAGRYHVLASLNCCPRIALRNGI